MFIQESAYAQLPGDPVDANHSVYLELGGNGLLYSINYDYRLNSDWSARVGLMHAGTSGVSFTNIPVMGIFLLGEDHNLELGAGPMYMGISLGSPDDEFMGISESGIAGTTTIGYRYQPEDGGFVFRTGLTPIFGGFGTATWAGLSVGYSF